MDEDFGRDYIPLSPTDYKGYAGYFAEGKNEAVSVFIHTGCGNLVGDVEAHRRTCSEQAQ